MSVRDRSVCSGCVFACGESGFEWPCVACPAAFAAVVQLVCPVPYCGGVWGCETLHSGLPCPIRYYPAAVWIALNGFAARDMGAFCVMDRSGSLWICYVGMAMRVVMWQRAAPFLVILIHSVLMRIAASMLCMDMGGTVCYGSGIA